MKPQKARRVVRVDAEALAKVRASQVLALSADTLGGITSLPAEETQPEEPQGAVGVVRIEGPIAQRAVSDLCGYVDGYDAIAARFELAISDESVDRVLMVIDSPGGDVAGIVEGVRAMLAAKAANPTKRVVCYVDELAASAAYWIASTVADEIVVPETGRVGSIGTIAAYADTTKAQAADGVTWTVIRDPAGKADTMPLSPVHDVAIARLTELVQDSTSRFIAAVSKARGVSPKKLRDLNGAVLGGQKAVAAGLADRVGTLKDAIEGASGRKGRKGPQMQTIAAAFGLSADATEYEIEKAVTETMGRMFALYGVDNLKALEGAMVGASERLGLYGERVKELEAEIAEMAEAKRKDDIAKAVDSAVAARKVTPARRDEFMAKAQARGLEFTLALIDELPVLVGAEAPPKPAKTEGEELSEDEARFCAEVGADPKVYLANKRRMLAAQAKGAA